MTLPLARRCPLEITDNENTMLITMLPVSPSVVVLHDRPPFHYNIVGHGAETYTLCSHLGIRRTERVRRRRAPPPVVLRLAPAGPTSTLPLHRPRVLVTRAARGVAS